MSTASTIKPLIKLIAKVLSENNISFKYRPSHHNPYIIFGEFIIILSKIQHTPYIATARISFDRRANIIITDITPCLTSASLQSKYGLSDPALCDKIAKKIKEINNSYKHCYHGYEHNN